MAGLLEEGKKIMEEDAEPCVMDAALIAAAQKVEHYEIASYGCVCTYAEMLGLRSGARAAGPEPGRGGDDRPEAHGPGRERDQPGSRNASRRRELKQA